MADKKYIKGLFKDTAHIDQPEGTWRYAKNMVLNEKIGSVSNEGGISGYTIGSRSDFNGEYLPIEVYHATVHEIALTEQEVAQNFEALRRRVTISSGIPHGT